MTPNFKREWKPRFPKDTQPEWMPHRMLTLVRLQFKKYPFKIRDFWAGNGGKDRPFKI